MAARTAAYFALTGLIGSLMFYPAGLLAFLGLLPALLLIPISFMIGGAVAGAKLGLPPEDIRSLSWAFALVGIGVFGSEIVAESAAAGVQPIFGSASIAGGFVTAGLAGTLGGFAGRRARVFLAFTVGGAVGAVAVLALSAVDVRTLVRVVAGAVTGLGTAGALAADRADR